MLENMIGWIIAQVVLGLLLIVSVIDAIATSASNGSNQQFNPALIWAIISGFLFYYANKKRKEKHTKT